MKPWTLERIWNEGLETKEERVTEERDRIYASELGRSDVDIWLKLKGETPTNPPNNRSKRKFEAGNIWEWIIRLVLMRAGILVSAQTAVKTKKGNLLEVSGKLDYIAGGKPNYDLALEELRSLMLPDILARATENMIHYFQANYPEGLDEKVLEIKSVSSFAFERVEKTGKAIPGHDLQTFHYAHSLGKEAAICYICRDDCRMAEVPILPNDQRLLERYMKKVETITGYYNDNVMPEPEPPIIFDDEMGRFSKNFNVEYSPFLQKLYGWERPDLYDEEISPLVGRWNRVLTRIRAGKELTKDNLVALEEMKARGFDVDTITKKIKQTK